MLLPSNRVQSPISTASANPVNVEIPLKQPSRCTIDVQDESAANSSIRVPSRSRRAAVVST
jgi:hypothetical protein